MAFFVSTVVGLSLPSGFLPQRALWALLNIKTQQRVEMQVCVRQINSSELHAFFWHINARKLDWVKTIPKMCAEWNEIYLDCRAEPTEITVRSAWLTIWNFTLCRSLPRAWICVSNRTTPVLPASSFPRGWLTPAAFVALMCQIPNSQRWQLGRLVCSSRHVSSPLASLQGTDMKPCHRQASSNWNGNDHSSRWLTESHSLYARKETLFF